MHEEDSREQQSPGSLPPAGPHPQHSMRDPAYAAFQEWYRRRQKPWYNQGWFWALLTVAGLAILAWQLGNISQAVQASAEATREQTGAIREQTQVMKEQGSWILQQLQAIERSITNLGHSVREAIAWFQSSLGH